MSDDKPEDTPEKFEGFTLTVKPDGDGRPLMVYDGPDDTKIQRHVSVETVKQLGDVAATLAKGQKPTLATLMAFMKKK